jgi:hypothetical protein
MADRLSDDEVKNIINRVMPGYKVLESNSMEDAVDSAASDAVETNAEAVAPGLDEMKASVRVGENLADSANPADRALADILQNFSSVPRERTLESASEPAKRDRVVSVEPEGKRDLSDRKSRVKSVLISGETGDVDVRQG